MAEKQTTAEPAAGRSSELQVTKKRRSPRRLFKGLAFLLVCSVIMAVIVYSPLFTLQRVIIHGNTYLTQDDIMDIGRLHIGQPLFQLETDAVTQNLMHDLRIESAVVKRRVPDSLEIDVTERMPVATVASDYGYMDLDRKGKVIACYRSLRNMPIPLITGVSLHDLYVGDDNQDEIVASVLEFLQQLDSNALNQLSEINIANKDAIMAYTNSSVQIRLGRLDRIEEKAKLTQDFIENLKNTTHEVEYVDFSYTAPFIRLKNMPDERESDTNTNAQ